MKAYRIPKHDEMPSEEMIDWLGENTMDWSGDESGIALDVLRANGEDEYEVGGPGDWVVCTNSVYRIRNDEWMKQYVNVKPELVTYEGPDE